SVVELSHVYDNLLRTWADTWRGSEQGIERGHQTLLEPLFPPQHEARGQIVADSEGEGFVRRHEHEGRRERVRAHAPGMKHGDRRRMGDGIARPRIHGVTVSPPGVFEIAHTVAR